MAPTPTKGRSLTVNGTALNELENIEFTPPKPIFEETPSLDDDGTVKVVPKSATGYYEPGELTADVRQDSSHAVLATLQASGATATFVLSVVGSTPYTFSGRVTKFTSKMSNKTFVKGGLAVEVTSLVT